MQLFSNAFEQSEIIACSIIYNLYIIKYLL